MKKTYQQSYGSVVFCLGLPSRADLIKTIVRDLWALRLSKLLHRLDTTLQVDVGSKALSSAAEIGDARTRKATRIVDEGIESLKLIETIALCYMGILILRLSISLQELYR